MSTMVVFIAGILTGWIVEWLFFTFFVKKTDDVSSESVAQNTSESVSVDKGRADRATKPLGNDKQETKTEPKTEAKAEAKAEIASDVGHKDSNNIETSKEQSTKPKAAKPVSTKSNSAPTKKEAKKDTPDKKDTAERQVKKGKNAKADDLTALKGVGPKLAKSLSVIGINSFSELAKLKGSDIVKQLEEAGHKVINKPGLDNLAPQAKLAAKGDAEGLAALQKSL